MAERDSTAKQLWMIDDLSGTLYEYQSASGDRTKVKKQFETHPEWLPEGTTAFLFGSVLYGDSQKERPDVDILLFGKGFSDTEFPLSDNIQGMLDLAFPERIVEIQEISLEDIQAEASHSQRVDEETASVGFYAAIILSSPPMFPRKHKEIVEQARAVIRQLAQEHPEFRDNIIRDLAFSLGRRRERRGQA